MLFAPRISSFLQSSVVKCATRRKPCFKRRFLRFRWTKWVTKCPDHAGSGAKLDRRAGLLGLVATYATPPTATTPSTVAAAIVQEDQPPLSSLGGVIASCFGDGIGGGGFGAGIGR